MKILHPEHVSMVSQSEGTHAIRFSFGDQPAYAGSTIQYRILTVNVKMCKRDHGSKELT